MASSDRNREEEEEEEEEEEVSMEWIKNPDLKFKPTDEILAYYLRKKAAGRNDGIFEYIRNVDVYECQPSELSSRAYDFGDGKKRMYFVTALKMKYLKGKTKVDRLTKDTIGFWKITGKISYVKKDGREIASKTALAYYKNKTSDKPEKSQWLMTEYRLIEDQSTEEPERLALCVIYLSDTKNGKRVREEREYEKGEGSNSKTIAPEAASSSLSLTENSIHQDTLESLAGIQIAYSDQNKPVMQSWQLELGYQPSFQDCIEIPSPAYFGHSSQLGLRNQPSFQECLEIPSPAYFGQNMAVMESQGSNYPYRNMPYPVMKSIDSNYPHQNMPYQVMGSQDSNLVQNIPNQVMELHGAKATDSNDRSTTLGMEFIFSNNLYENMPGPEMESPGSNFVQNIPNQEMGLHGATAHRFKY